MVGFLEEDLTPKGDCEINWPFGASTIILSKDIDKHAFMCGPNFYETDVREAKSLLS